MLIVLTILVVCIQGGGLLLRSGGIRGPGMGFIAMIIAAGYLFSYMQAVIHTTAAEDKLIAAGKMAAPPRGQLSLEQFQARAARWYAAGADGVHLFNAGNREVLKTLGSVPAGKEAEPAK